ARDEPVMHLIDGGVLDTVEMLGAVDVERSFDGEDVGVGEVVVGAELEDEGSHEVLGAGGVAGDGERAERFEVDEKLAPGPLAEGDKAGDGRRLVGVGNGRFGVVETPPRPSTGDGFPRAWRLA